METRLRYMQDDDDWKDGRYIFTVLSAVSTIIFFIVIYLYSGESERVNARMLYSIDSIVLSNNPVLYKGKGYPFIKFEFDKHGEFFIAEIYEHCDITGILKEIKKGDTLNIKVMKKSSDGIDDRNIYSIVCNNQEYCDLDYLSQYNLKTIFSSIFFITTSIYFFVIGRLPQRPAFKIEDHYFLTIIIVFAVFFIIRFVVQTITFLSNMLV